MLRRRYVLAGLSILLMVLVLGAIGSGTTAHLVQEDPAPAARTEPPDNTTADPAPESAGTPPIDSVRDVPAAPREDIPASVAAPDAAPSAPPSPKDYGLWVLLPALVAILFAILTRQVIPALITGVFVGAWMMLPHLSPEGSFAHLRGEATGWTTIAIDALRALRTTFETYVMAAIRDPDHLMIMLFTLIVGFTVGVIGRNGGTEGMVRVVAGSSSSPLRARLAAWFAGMVVFFDDYANSMIVGPTMRPVFDRLRISRAKLAYIVDSTAAPVASLAIIGTWIGAEIGFITSGLEKLEGGRPEWLGETTTGMELFLSSLRYRFYPILALFLVFLISLTNRDFGPMRKSERRTLSTPPPPDVLPDKNLPGGGPPPSWLLGLFPILVLVLLTLVILAVTGYGAEDATTALAATDEAGVRTWPALPLWRKLSIIVRGADAYRSILYGAIASSFVAVLMTLASRVCKVKDAVEAGVEGMARMFPAVVILVLAWSLSKVSEDLKLGEIVSQRLLAGEPFSVRWLPLAVFACSAGISFATGTSWGTMGIMCPVVVEVAARMLADVPAAEASALFSAAIGSVLAGAVFGDHCSPISDTTVLSSLASSCPHEEHVWTQIPYALVTAMVAMGLGDVLCSAYHQPWYYGLGAGAVALILIVLVFGRRAVATPMPAVAPGPSRWRRDA
jgi:Na+/H+ antiporter NhaC